MNQNSYLNLRFKKNRRLNIIGSLLLFFLIIFLSSKSNVVGDERDGAKDRGTRDVIIYAETSCNDTSKSILPGENTTYEIKVEICHNIEPPYDFWLWTEDIPMYWNVNFDETNFTVYSDSFYVMLFISPPLNASVGFISEITVDGIFKPSNGSWDEDGCDIYTIQLTTRIIGPDLWVYSFEILESEEEPKEGQLIYMYARIRNVGEVNVTNVPIRFLVDGEQFGPNWTIPIIETGNYTNESITWIGIEGDHNLTVEVDFDYLIDEHSETNNNLTLTISIVGKRPIRSYNPLPYLILLLIIILIIFILIYIFKQKERKK